MWDYLVKKEEKWQYMHSVEFHEVQFRCVSGNKKLVFSANFGLNIRMFGYTNNIVNSNTHFCKHPLLNLLV